MRGLTIVFLLIPFGIAVAAFVSPPNEEERWIPLALVLGFLALVTPLAVEVFRRRLRIEEDALVSESPWTGLVRIPWGEVTAVSFKPSMSWYVIASRGRKPVRFATLMSGLETLAVTLATRAPRVPGVQTGIERMRSGRELG